MILLFLLLRKRQKPLAHPAERYAFNQELPQLLIPFRKFEQLCFMVSGKRILFFA